MVEVIDTHSVCQLQAIGTQGRLCFGWYLVCVPHFENVCATILEHSVCQLETIDTQGRLCLDWHTVCVPHFENTECVCHNFGTRVCQLETIDTQGRLCLDWHPVCVPHLENTECVCHNSRTQCVCVALRVVSDTRLHLQGLDLILQATRL